MNNNLTCPICDRIDIEGDICPNCETNLSVLKLLTNLPVNQRLETRSSKSKTILIIGLILLILIFGISIGFGNNYLLSTGKTSTNQSSAITQQPNLSISEQSNLTTQKATEEIPQEKGCGGFYYTVKNGDSLSIITNKFYGIKADWSLITQANQQLQSREDALKIGEVLFIPNLDNNCPQKSPS